MGLFNNLFKQQQPQIINNCEEDLVNGIIRSFIIGRGLIIAIHKITTETTNKGSKITIKADQPYNLVGPGGCHSKDLARVLSKELDTIVKLNIIQA
jgi:ribosomal protein S3